MYFVDQAALIFVRNNTSAANALRIFLNKSSLSLVPPYTFTLICILWKALNKETRDKLLLALKLIPKLKEHYTKVEIVTVAMETEPINAMPFLLEHEPLFLKLLSLLGVNSEGLSVESFLNTIDQYIDQMIQLLNNYQGLIEKMLAAVNQGVDEAKQQAMRSFTKGGKRTKKKRKRSKRRVHISRSQK